MAKRPEITITPIPRSLNESLSGLAAAAAAVSSQNSILSGSSFPTSCLKALGFDISAAATAGLDLDSVDFNALNNLAELAQKYEKNNQAMAAAAAAAAAAAVVACEPAAKRFKSDDNRLNGTRYPPPVSSDRGGRTSHPTEQSVPDLVSADFLRSMNMLDANSKLLLPAHQSTKTINALAALLPQTSIFPAPAPPAHQQNSIRSPIKTPQSNSPRPELPRIFQSQNLYSQGNRIYDKPIADTSSNSPSLFATSSPKESSNTREPPSKSTSPEVQILDLSRSSNSPSIGKNGKSSKCDRLDVELLDLSTRRDITVSAVPKPNNNKSHHLHHSRLGSSTSSVPQVSIKSSSSILDGITITPNHSSNSSSISISSNNNNSSNNIINRNYNRSNSGGGGSLSGADLSSLMGGMPGAALMAAAAAAAQGLPPGLAGLGLGGGALGHAGGSLPPSLLPFLMGSAGGGGAGGGSSSSKGGGGGNPNNGPPGGAGHMFPYLDAGSLAAYYNTLLPHSLIPTSTTSSPSTSSSSSAQQQQQQQQQQSLNNSIVAAHQAAAAQMAQLNSLGLSGIAGLTGGGPPGSAAGVALGLQHQQQGGQQLQLPPGVSCEALANLGMYKNFLGAAAAGSNTAGNNHSNNVPGGSSSSMLPPPHFLAALMSPGTKPKK